MIGVVLAFITVAINYFWYKFLIRNLGHALRNLGVLSKPIEKKKVEDARKDL